MINYIFSLNVYQTTMEGHGGGNNKLTKKFDTLDELLTWEKKVLNKDKEYLDWLNIHFPTVLNVFEYKLIQVEETIINTGKASY